VLVTLRYGITNALLIAFIAALVAGGWWIWLVIGIGLLAGGLVDEIVGDDHRPVPQAAVWFYELNLYATLPLTMILTVVLLHHFVPSDPIGLIRLLSGLGIEFAAAPSLTRIGPLAGAIVGAAYFYALATVTVAHELTHRTDDPCAMTTGKLLLGFTLSPSFAIAHVYCHHRYVGTARDSATARRGEYVLAFVLRSTVQQNVEAFAHEAARLRRLRYRPWSWRNRALLGQTITLGILGASAVIAGVNGVLVFLACALLAKVFHELVNYVQHYGLVRIEGAPIEPRHAWDSYRTLSNALQYNLPRHSDHHLKPYRPFWQLETRDDAPVLAAGYKTSALTALIPPIWHRLIDPRLADWDRRLASKAERAALMAQGQLIAQRDGL
jgi:hypothetical protein